MVYVLDTLAYAKRLQTSGVPKEQAEAHAESVRDFVMIGLVTKQDLSLALDNLKLSLTVRLGAMLFLAVGGLAALLKLPL
jgi:hypothetical protein